MGIISFFILLFLSFFCLWRIRNKFSISTSYLMAGWSIKLVFAFSFVLVFSHFYGNGTLYGDAYNFINDSRILNLYGRENPGEYLKLLLGLADETTLFSQSILAETNIWSYGENGDFINDNRLIIRINSLIHFVSFGNIYVHALVLAFLAYIGMLLLFEIFVRFVKNKPFFFFTLILFPSIGFWGSGITKEALLIFSLGLFFYGIFRSMRAFSWQSILCFLLGGFMLLFNKPHVGLIIITLVPFLIIGSRMQWNRTIRLVFPVIVMAGLVVMTYTPSQFNLLEKVSYKQRDLINMGKGGIFFVSDSAFCAFDYSHLNNFIPKADKKIEVLTETSGEYKLFGQQSFHPFSISPSDRLYDVYLIQPPSNSYIPVTPIAYKRGNLIRSIPAVFFNTILRPLPWDPGSSLKFFSFISNLCLIGFAFYVLFNRRKLGSEEKYVLLYFLIAAILLLLIIGWTTPILGAIVRYKIAAELCLLILLSILLKPLKNA